MAHWYEHLSNQTLRAALGERFEALADKAFDVLRWAAVVGFARYLTLEAPSIWFDVIYWTTSALMLGLLASLFLLRPEIPIFRHPDRPWKRLTQTVANTVLCMMAFMLVMRGINALVDGIVQYRFSAAM